MIIVKYIFDHNIYANLIPQFNEGYTYTIKDEVGTYTTRTIESDVLPTKIQFGNLDGSSSLLEVLEIDTTNVTDMGYMFYNCKTLTSLDLSGFDTSKVTNMYGMFYNCNKLTSLNLSNFDTSNVTNMGAMFNNCNNLISLNLSNFDTKNVTNMNSMFNNCNNLIYIKAYECSSQTIEKIVPLLLNSPIDYKPPIIRGNVAIDESKLVYNWVYENIDPMVVLRYTSKVDSFTPSFNSEFTSSDYTKTVETIDDGYLISIYRNGDKYPTTFKFNNANIIEVDVIEFRDNLRDLSEAFKDATALRYINMYFIDTKNVTSMYQMFYGCKDLISLDLSNFDTKNVTNMNSMFSGCKALTSLDLSNFDTKNVTNMSGMFQNSNALTSLEVSGFVTSNVTNMSYMFRNCNALISLDVSNFDTKNVTSMNGMFYGCNKLTSLDVSNFDTKNVTNMYQMFHDCIVLTFLDVSNFDTKNVTNMSEMFGGCKALISLDVSNFDTSKVTNINGMFQNCNSLTSLDISNFDTKNVTNMYAMFYGCNALTSLDVSNFNTSKVTNMGSMFQNCNTLTSLDVSNFDTTKVTTMDSMFAGCQSLTSLDVSNFNTSNVQYMSGMFYNCNALTSLDLSNFDTSSVTNMNAMFQNCSALTSLNVSNFDTSSVKNMYQMFQNCNSLTSLDVSGFDTKNVTSMAYMFYNCNALTSLDLSNFDTKNVATMSNMFNGCRYLTSLDISNFNTSNVESFSNALNNCNRLTDIGMVYCSKDTVEQISNLINASNVNIWIDMDIEKPKDTDKVTYKQYAEDYEILLTSPLLEGDTIEEIDGDLYHVHRYGQVTLDGSENWGGSAGSYYIERYDMKRLQDYTNEIKCDKLITIKYNGIQTSGITGYIQNNNYANQNWIYINSFGDNSKTREELISWLQQNPIKVVYQLAEPTYEKIGTQDELKFANEKIKPITSVPLTDTELNYTDDSIRLTKESRYVGNEAKLNEKFSNVELSGRTMVNVCDQKDPIPLTRSYTVESGNHVALEGEYDGKAKPYVYGNTLVNLAGNGNLWHVSSTGVPNTDYIFLEQNDRSIKVNKLTLIDTYFYLRKKIEISRFKPNSEYTFIFTSNNVNVISLMSGNAVEIAIGDYSCVNGFNCIKVTSNDFSTITGNLDIVIYARIDKTFIGEVSISDVIILEGDYTNKPIPQYFEGLQSSFEDGRVPENMWDTNNIVKRNDTNVVVGSGIEFTNVVSWGICGVKLSTKVGAVYTVRCSADFLSYIYFRDGYDLSTIATLIGTMEQVCKEYVYTFTARTEQTLVTFEVNATDYIKISDIIILEGDYSNYDFSDYDSANVGKYKVEYKVTGKNKFDGWEQGHINDLGELYDDPNSVRSNYIKVIPNTQYTFSNNGIKRATHISYYDERKQFIFTSDRGHPPSTFVMPSNCMYIRLSGGNNDRDKFQLEEGEVATSYEPYKEYTKTLYLNSPLLEGDSIEVSGNNIYHIHRYGKITLDGSSNIYSAHTYKSDKYRWEIYRNSSIANVDGGIVWTKNNKYPDIKANDTWGTGGTYKDGIAQNNSSNVIFLYLDRYSDGSDESLNALKRELNEQPVTVVYQLASPTYEVISSNDNLYIDSYVNGHLDFDSAVPIDKVRFMYAIYGNTLRYLRPNTKYTIQFNADNIGKIIRLMLGGAYIDNFSIVKGVNTVEITTLDTIVLSNSLINGIGCNISNIVVTEAIDEEFGYFGGLQSVGEGNEINIKVTGKNKFDKDRLTMVMATSSTYEIINDVIRITDNYGATTTSSSYHYVIFKYYIHHNFTFSYKYNASKSQQGAIGLRKYDALGNQIGNTLTLKDGESVSINDKVDYVEFLLYVCRGEAGITRGDYIDYYDIQIEEGTTPTSYEPYYEYTKTLYLNSPLLEGDRIIAKNDGLYHEHRYGKYIVTGEEELRSFDVDNVTQWYIPDLLLDMIEDRENVNGLTDRFPMTTTNDRFKETSVNHVWVSHSNVCLMIEKSKSTEQYARELIKGMKLIYKLASSTYEKISDDILLAKVASTGTLEVQSAVPCSEIALTNAKKELKYLYVNKDYTVQFVAHGQGEVVINLGGTNKTVNVVDGLNTFQIKTPSTLLHNNLYLNGTDIYVEDIVVTNSVQDNIGYFDGLQSSYEDKEIEFVVTDENDKVVNRKKYTLSSPLLKDDTIECVDGKLYHVHRYGKIVFNSSSGWVYNSTMSANSEFYAFYKSDSSLNRKAKGYVYCDQLPSLLFTESVASNIIIKECIRTDSSSALYLFISSSKINESAEELDKYLAENPITIVYELAEPTYELIDEIGYIDSYANGHIILNDTVIPIQEFKTLAFEEELAYLYANTSYTIQFESDKESHVKFYLGGTEYSTNIIKGLNRVTITTPSTLVDNILRLNGTDVKISEVVVVNSDKDFGYFEGLQSVSEDGSLEIKSCNKNIIDNNLKNWRLLTGTPTYTFSNEGKTLSVTYTDGWNHGVILTTRLKKGTYYCGLSKTGNVDMYYNDGTSNDVNISNKTFTISNDTVVNFKLKNTNNVGGTYTVSDVYINEKTDLGYTPHQSNSQVMTHEPLRAIGDIKDRYVLKDGKWYIERNCAEVVLDGSENWMLQTNANTVMVFTNNLLNTKCGDIICDKLQVGDISGKNCIGYYGYSNNLIFIKIRKEELSTLDLTGFRQWLAENPTTVVYQLATPIYEVIDYTPFEVSSDKTYITTNSVIPPYITVKNTGFNCNVMPNTTYTIASNKGIHHITTASELDGALRFYGTGKLSGLRVLDGIAEDYTIPSVFKGLQNAFGQEYFGNIANKKLYGSVVRYEKGDIVTNNVTNRVCYIINNPKPDTVYTIISRTQGLISTNSCYLGNEKSTELTQLSVDIFENGIYTVRTNADASKALAVNMKYDNERDINIDEIECYVVEGDWSDMTEKDFTDNFGKYKVNFKMRGKNLFDASQVIANKYQSGADDRYAIVDNEEYSLYYLQGISNMIITSNVALSGVWYSNELPIMEQESDTMFTVPFGCNIFALRIPKNVNINNLQIEVGDEATTYRQYQEYNVTFYIEQPLRSFKDFEDTFMWRENTLFVKRRCGELVLNGSEDWLAYSTNNEANNIAFKLENYLETTYTDDEVYCVSDLFTATPAKNIHNDIEGISFVNKDIIIKVSRAKLLTQDVDGFKQYLQKHNTTVVYNTGNIVYEEIGLIDKLLPLYDESTLSYNTVVPVKTTLSYSTKTPSIVGANDNIATLQSINDEQDMQTLELQYKMCLLEMLLEDEEGL